MSAPYPAKSHCRSIPPRSRRILVRSSASKRCAPRSRRSSPRQGLWRGGHATVRSPATGLPLIGPVPGVADAYVATGHSVWGILNAPATGEAMAELIVDGAAHAVDL